jgi:hypothetical protein
MAIEYASSPESIPQSICVWCIIILFFFQKEGILFLLMPEKFRSRKKEVTGMNILKSASCSAVLRSKNSK